MRRAASAVNVRRLAVPTSSLCMRLDDVCCLLHARQDAEASTTHTAALCRQGKCCLKGGVRECRCSLEDSDSHSYPGLPCQYLTCHVDVTVSGLPDRGSKTFVTREKRGAGYLENHWAWVDPADAPMHKL